MSKVFAIDVAKCNGCYGCQIVCKDEHCGNDWSPIAAAQPETGHFWLKIDEKTRGQVPVVKVSYTPVICGHCADAPCLAAATDGAVYRREDGLIIIDPEKAKGQKAIMEACPLGAIYWNEALDLPQKCTGCAHLLDEGWSVPRCVDACSHDAIRYADEEELADFIAEAEVLPALEGLAPRVYYKNLPKRFIAGCAVDFEADEVIIGAQVTLKGEGVELSQATDEFGDFQFEGIQPGVYEVTIAAEGYAAKVLEVDVTGIDKTVGDIAIEK